MAIDYQQMATTALNMITSSGRPVTFVQLDRDAASAATPWDGAADPQATPDATVAGYAVFLSPGAATALGTSIQVENLMRRSSALLITSLGPSATADLLQYDEVVDGSVRWTIQAAEALNPGDTALVYFMGVSGR